MESLNLTFLIDNDVLNADQHLFVHVIGPPTRRLVSSALNWSYYSTRAQLLPFSRFPYPPFGCSWAHWHSSWEMEVVLSFRYSFQNFYLDGLLRSPYAEKLSMIVISFTGENEVTWLLLSYGWVRHLSSGYLTGDLIRMSTSAKATRLQIRLNASIATIVEIFLWEYSENLSLLHRRDHQTIGCLFIHGYITELSLDLQLGW